MRKVQLGDHNEYNALFVISVWFAANYRKGRLDMQHPGPLAENRARARILSSLHHLAPQTIVRETPASACSSLHPGNAMPRRWHFGPDRLLPCTGTRHAGAFHDGYIHHKMSVANTLRTPTSGPNNTRVAPRGDNVGSRCRSRQLQGYEICHQVTTTKLLTCKQVMWRSWGASESYTSYALTLTGLQAMIACLSSLQA
jgi:hypothetical protein